jgi:poly-gamma-glutamate synthesis protein (capsule biosynthesis protein)
VALCVPATFIAASRHGPAAALPGRPDATTGETAEAAPGSTARARTFDIVAAGDILPHPSISRTALGDGRGTRYDFTPMFAALRPLISRAALAICHVEIPLTDAPPTMDPTFSAPTEVASAIAWAGFDVCSTASNHTLDQHQAGVDSTLAALDRAGVAHAGSYASAADAARIPILNADGVRVAFLAYTYGTNGIPPPDPWSVNLISYDRIAADATRARHDGADLVIVNLHWGTQYDHAPNDMQRSLATELLSRHVVDAIVGEHAHVVQPIERISGRFVSYGEGNLLASQYPYDGYPIDTLDGLVTVIHVRAVGRHAIITGMDYVPTFIERPAFRVVPIGAELRRLIDAGEGSSRLAEDLRAAYRRVVDAVGRGPSIAPIPPRLP